MSGTIGASWFETALCASSPWGKNLFIQPHVLEAQIVVLAVVVGVKILHIRLPAIAGRAPQNARTRGVIDQKMLDLPDQLGPLVAVQFARLRRQQLVDVGVTVLGIIALGLAGIILDDIAVGVVDRNA